MDPLPFDELNKLKATLPAFADADGKLKDMDPLLDMLEDLFLLAYASGVESTNLSLGASWEPSLTDILDTVDREIAGKTWRQRVREYYDNGGTVDDIARIAETETHRDANAGAYDAARAGGATRKTWNTMLDDRVRDSHQYLEGVSAPIDGVFYAWYGASTLYPGQWGIAEEDVNCRCWLTYS